MEAGRYPSAAAQASERYAETACRQPYGAITSHGFRATTSIPSGSGIHSARLWVLSRVQGAVIHSDDACYQT